MRGRVALGNIRVVSLGEGRVEMQIVTGAGEYIKKPKLIKASDLEPKTRNALKNYIDENGMIFLDMRKAQGHLVDQGSRALNGGMADLLANTNKVYKTGDIPARLRRLAANLDLHIQLRGNMSRVLMVHYQGTARLIFKMINEVEDGVNVFQKNLDDLNYYSKAIKKTLKDTSIDHTKILEAINKWKARMPDKEARRIPDFDSIKGDLPFDMIANRRLGNQEYDNFISNLYQLQELEELMVKQFAVIDEMFSLERKALKNLEGALPANTPKTFDEFIGGSTNPGFGDLMNKLEDQFNAFTRYLSTSPISVGTRMAFDNIKAAVRAEINLTGFIIRNTSRQAYNYLRQVDLATVKQFFKDNMAEIFITVITLPALYKVLEGLKIRLSRKSEPEPETVKENKAILNEKDRKAFNSFLDQFIIDLKKMDDEAPAGESPIEEIEEELGSISDPQGKLDYLFDIFNSIKKEDKQKNENRIITMKKTDLRKLVSEMLNENTGMGYAKYPYHAEEYSEAEPDEDYMSEWKLLVDEVCGRKKKNVDGDPSTVEDSAVEVAKLLVKDSDLFREVLELAGSNKSVGTEIMKQLKLAKDKSMVDNKPKV